MPEIKTYHRVQSTTQTAEIAALQKETLEIWGTPPRKIYRSDTPKVKAYVGSLDDKKGIEFTTDVEPDPCCPPDQAFWTGPRAGVEYAILKVLTVKLNY